MKKKSLIIGGAVLLSLILIIGSVFITKSIIYKRILDQRYTFGYNQKYTLPEITEHRRALDELLSEEEKQIIQDIRDKSGEFNQSKSGLAPRYNRKNYRRNRFGDNPTGEISDSINRKSESYDALLSIINNHEEELDSILKEANLHKYSMLYNRGFRNFDSHKDFHRRGRGSRMHEGRNGRRSGRGIRPGYHDMRPSNIGPIQFLLLETDES